MTTKKVKTESDRKMTIEDYNRLRNVQHVTVSHNYSVTTHRNEELIDRLLNIRAFTCYVAKKMITKTKTINP